MAQRSGVQQKKQWSQYGSLGNTIWNWESAGNTAIRGDWKGTGMKIRCNPRKNSITESKPMRETFQENRMIDSIESCRKIQQAKTSDGLMADGLNKVIMDWKYNSFCGMVLHTSKLLRAGHLDTNYPSVPWVVRWPVVQWVWRWRVGWISDDNWIKTRGQDRISSVKARWQNVLIDLERCQKT